MKESLSEVYKDELTGVYIRKYLNLIFDRELARSKRYNDTLSILILDMDNFKEINDTFGHLEGDRALVEFARTLQDIVRESDTVIRYGGDEFVIVAPSTNFNGATGLANRVIDAVKDIKTSPINLRCSVGIATYPKHGVDFKSLFEYADRCLYDAKRSGKGKIGIFRDTNIAPRIPAPTFIGRRKERSVIIAGIKEPQKIHFIKGDAGIGKTRLVCDTLNVLGIKYAKGVSFGAITSLPYIAIRNLLLHMLKKFPSDLLNAYSKISEISRAQISNLVPQIKSKTAPPQSQQGDKFTLFAAVSELIGELSIDETLAIVFDDLHWADQLSLELIYYLKHMMFPNIIIFGIYRGDEITDSPMENIIHLIGRERLYDELELLALNYPETKMLAESILQCNIDEILAGDIYQFSGGNPFFIEEFIHTMYEKGKLFFKNGKWKYDRGVKIEISKSIKDTIERKLERLDDKEYQVLKYTACAGKEFYPEVISSILKINLGEIMGVLDKLVKINILAESGHGEFYSFKEDAIRLVILDNIGDGVKRLIYNTIGEYMESNIGVNDKNVEMILHYFQLAKNHEKLALYGEMAGDRSESVYAHDNAIKFYEYALKGNEKTVNAGTLHSKIGYAYLLKGEYNEALKHFEKAIELAQDTKSETQGRFIAYTYSLLGEREKAIYHYEKAIEFAKSREEKTGYKFMLAFQFMGMGQKEKAEQIAKEAIAEIPEAKEDLLAFGYNILGVIYQQNTEKYSKEKAKKYFKKAIELAKRGNVEKRNIAAFYNNLAGLYAMDGKFNDALTMFMEVKRLHEEMNFAFGKSLIYGNLAMLYKDMGNAEKSIEYVDKGIRINNATNNIQANMSLYIVKGEMLFQLGKYEEAIHVLKIILSTAKDTSFEYINSLALLLKCYIETDNLDMAKDAAKTLEDIVLSRNLQNISIVEPIILYYIYSNKPKKSEVLLNILEKQGQKDKMALIISVLKAFALKEGYEAFKNINAIKEYVTNNFMKLWERAHIYYLIGIALKKQDYRLSQDYLELAEHYTQDTDFTRLKTKIAKALKKNRNQLC